MRVCAIIPCYRGSGHVCDVISGLLPQVEHVFLVDDACPEHSGDLVTATFSPDRVTVIRHAVNRGVGGSMVDGYRAALAVGFEVMVGGGLGRTPFIAKTISRFLHKRDLLSYVEAILRVYNQYGRRDNIYKARIKILVHELGIEKFAKEVEEEWLQMRDSALAISAFSVISAPMSSRLTAPS